VNTRSELEQARTHLLWLLSKLELKPEERVILQGLLMQIENKLAAAKSD
jgi:hypothetical protein